MKRLLYNYFEHPSVVKFGVYFQVFIFLNIFISVIVLFLQTEKSLKEYYDILDGINDVSMFFFLLEYCLRFYSIGEEKNFGGIIGRIKYVLSPFALIDLLAILPYFLTFLGFDLNFLRSLRFVKTFRLFRVAKFTEFDELIVSIFEEHKEEFLYILVFSFFLIVVLSSIIYNFEHEVQPELYSSMASSMWWAIITFTTVGYGDMYPVTVGGKIVTTFTAFLGVFLYAIPGGIFTSSLIRKLNERKKEKLKKNQK